jgi:hypothetical protein
LLCCLDGGHTSCTVPHARRHSALLRNRALFRREGDLRFGAVTSSGSSPRTSRKTNLRCALLVPSRESRIVLRRATKWLTIRILLGLAGQPLRMHQQAQLDLLVLALAELDHRGVAAMRADHALLRSSTRKRVSSGATYSGTSGAIRAASSSTWKLAAALAAAMFPMLDGERLHRHHRAGHDRRAMAAARHLTRAVLGPEGVDDLRAFVAVVLRCSRGGERDRNRRASPRLVGRCVHFPFSPFGPSQ